MAQDIKKLAKEEGGYQDIEIGGKLLFDGWRDCKERWKLIEPYINKNSVVMDIGSHYGYFSMRVAEKYPDCLVWSVESGDKRAEIQRLVLEANELKNVILTEHEMTIYDFLKLARTTEGIDTILMLSVIHYFPLEDIPEILWLMSMIAPRLILEMPSSAEVEVAEKESVDKLEGIERYLNFFYKNVAKIGETTSPKDPNVKRTLWRAENSKLSKSGLAGYLGGEIGKPHKLKYDGEWRVDNKRKWTIGLNLFNLKKFNIIYPAIEKLERRSAERYFDIMKTKGAPTDISYRNVIVTPFDLNIIDFDEGRGKEIYGMPWQEYHTMIKHSSIDDFDKILKERF